MVDRLGKDAVEVSRPAGHDALVQPCELELPRGDQPDGVAPEWEAPFIRLFPYADTSNPGGVYIMAICSLGPS